MADALLESVLLVDDDPNVLRIHATLLVHAGFSVLTSPGALPAMRVLAGGRVGAIVTDLTMPGVSGGELVQQVNRLGVNIPIIVLSGYSFREMAERTQGVGVFRYLRKPVSANELVLAVMQAMSAKQVRALGDSTRPS